MTGHLVLKTAAILWVIWGLVHAFAGVMVITSDASAGFAAIADAIEPALLAHNYHPAAGGVLNQHGFNLLWFGIVTVVGALFIWRGSVTAIFVTAMVGGLADLGYLIYVDVPGYVRFFPGTVMTMISSSAILLSFGAWAIARRATA